MARPVRSAAITVLALVVAIGLAASSAAAAPPSISIDAAKNRGFVSPSAVGQMMEWALPEMNGAWAEKLSDRSLEADTVAGLSTRSPLYDAFAGSSLDRSRWTPMSLDTAPAGTVAVSGSTVTTTAAVGGRFGIMSNNVQGSRYAGFSVETKITAFTGTNAMLNLYAGTGAGDFTKYVEFGIEGGVLKVFADGQAPWVGGAATAPATLKIVATPLSDGGRDLSFYYNGTLVRTMTGFTLLTDPFRVFLYGWSGSVSYDYVTIDPDDTYDGFYGTSLSPRWTPTLLAGATSGTTSISAGKLTVNGGSTSRYGALSDYVQNSSTDWTTISARLTANTGTNALMNIYGGAGAGDFTHFVEFGVEGGVAKVFTSDGTQNFSGAAVTLPATLTVTVSPYYPNGRRFKFAVNGTQVYELAERRDVPAADFRVFLYGWSTSSSSWDWVNVSQRHMTDPFAPQFEGGPGLSVDWTPVSLAGSWGSASQGSGQLTINGAASSRYGIMSSPLDESDVYGYTVEAKLDSFTGTNGLLNIYGGTGRGDFTKYIEFGIEGGVLKVFGDGLTTWVGPAATMPAVLRVKVGPWTASGRSLYFFYNDQLVYAVENSTIVPNSDYHVFLYGFGTSVTKWDYLTWWRDAPWAEDGYADRAVYTHDRGAFNGTYAEKIDLTQHTTGRKGVSQRAIAVTAGHAYQVNVYMKQSGLTAPVTVLLGPAGGDGPSYTAYASASVSSVASAWTKYTVTLTPTTTDQQAKLEIASTGAGTLWVDMASVMPTDPSEVVNGGWRKDFVDRVTTLKPVGIRWPGGIIADWYHWADGVGARDSRPPEYYGQWDAEWMTNDIGTHEILDLAEALGLKTTLNVNWGTGSSTEAANWVEYANGASGTTYGAQRVANGRSLPWNVKNWEIGNETWGWWTPGWTSSASTFANSYVVFHDAMVAKDPTLEFFGEGGDGNSTDQTWNTTLLTTAAPKLDNLSVHFYPPQGLPQNYVSADVYNASVGSGATISTRLDGDQSTILANGSNEDVKVAVTEYNAMYFNEENRRTRTLEAGLSVAGQINLYARRPELIESNFASTLANFWDGGFIRLGNRGSFVTPGYEVMRLFGSNHGDVVAGTTVSSPTYNAPAMGNLPAKTGVPFVDATVTKAKDGSKLYVSVLNRDPTNTQPTSFTIANGGTIGTTATVYTVNAPTYLTGNSWAAPTAVAATTTTATVGASFSYTFPAHSYTLLVINTTAAAVTSPAVSGRVLNNATGNPIVGATVQVTGGGSATTDADGWYSIPAAAGTYTLTATAAGFTAKTRNHVEVAAGGSTALPFRM
jgi:alpha-N-arabinofuranosidase